MTVEERLAILEREQAETKAELGRSERRVRRLLIAGSFALACLAVLLAGWAWMPEAHARAQARVLREVCARKFVLVDEKDKRRARRLYIALSAWSCDHCGAHSPKIYKTAGDLRYVLCTACGKTGKIWCP